MIQFLDTVKLKMNIIVTLIRAETKYTYPKLV